MSASQPYQEPIYYFGYGPIVHPVVRKRRGVKTSEAIGALLPEYRLTFAFGGVVNIVRQRGYEVMGVLLKFDTQEDWSKFREYDAGYNLDEVLVNPLSDPTSNYIKAYTFVMKEFDSAKLEGGGLEKLPQERYLKLIASGMRSCNLDEEYIEDIIMSVPYVPKTKPEDFACFPKSTELLRKISFQKYQNQICKHGRRGDVYFVIGNRVLHLDPHDPENPCSVWFQERAHGKPDITLLLHRTVVDPDLPMVDTEEEITPAHTAWAENHAVEYLEQGGLTGKAVFEIITDDENDESPKLWFSSVCSSCRCWTQAGHGRSLRRRTESPLERDDPQSGTSMALQVMIRTRADNSDGDTDDSSLG